MGGRNSAVLRVSCCLILPIHLNPPQYGRRAILSSHLTILKMARAIYKYRRGARRDLWDEINRAAEDDGNTNYNPFSTRATRANRRLVATSNDTDGPLSKPNAPLGLRQDEADLDPPFRYHEGDAVRKFAEIGLAIAKHGPIWTNGPFSLNPLAHQRKIIFVEYGSRNPMALGK